MDKVKIEQFIVKQEKNLEFITERIKIQNEPDYRPEKLLPIGTRQIHKRKSETEYISIRERQYYEFDLVMIQHKINIAKKYLEKIC